MDSVKAHNYGYYSNPSPTSDFRDLSHCLQQFPNTPSHEPASTTPVSPSTAFATKSHISLNRPIVLIQNTLIIGNDPIHEQPTAKQQHQVGRTVEIQQSRWITTSYSGARRPLRPFLAAPLATLTTSMIVSPKQYSKMPIPAKARKARVRSAPLSTPTKQMPGEASPISTVHQPFSLLLPTTPVA